MVGSGLFCEVFDGRQFGFEFGEYPDGFDLGFGLFGHVCSHVMVECAEGD